MLLRKIDENLLTKVLKDRFDTRYIEPLEVHLHTQVAFIMADIEDEYPQHGEMISRYTDEIVLYLKFMTPHCVERSLSVQEAITKTKIIEAVDLILAALLHALRTAEPNLPVEDDGSGEGKPRPIPLPDRGDTGEEDSESRRMDM